MGFGLRTYQQTLTALNDWTGVLPTTTKVLGNGIEAWPEDIVGGLFCVVPDGCPPVLVRSVELLLGGQTSWTVHKRDLDGNETLIMCGEDDTDFISTQQDSFPMTRGQCLVLRTTGASTKMIARVTVQATG